MTPNSLIDLVLNNSYDFITGVPDSIFKHFLIAVNEDKRFEHVITNNEGESCALAAGYYLGTGKIPVVYMQNSGLGNSINPLTSLLDSYIYSIPTLLLIAWRGLPGKKDEPQHKRMGEILPGMLNLLDIPYGIADNDAEKMPYIFDEAKKYFLKNRHPYAILFPKGVIQGEEKVITKDELPVEALIRENLLESIINSTGENDLIITTTGKTSRELYEIRERLQHHHSQDFLTVGSMGCAASIALGIAMQRKDKRVILIDGDGACLMRMEALATIGHVQPENLLHVVIDNNAYESTGSQKTLSSNVDFPSIAKACGYRNALDIHTQPEFSEAFAQFQQGPVMLVVHSHPYSRPELGRPKTTPIENKLAFMQHLGVPV